MTKGSREEALRSFIAPHLRSMGEQLSFVYIQNTRLIVAVIDASVR